MPTKGPVTPLLLLSTPSTVKLLLRGRWPPTDGPVPAPTPPLLATPEPSSERFSTPKPMLDVGRSATALALNVFCTCAVVVSMAVAASCTSTEVATWPTCKLIFAVTVLLSSTVRSRKEEVPKPVAENVKMYWPMGKLENRYCPDAPVVAVAFEPVEGFCASTVAPGTAEPDASSTVPTISPLTDCAKLGTATAASSAINSTPIEHVFFIFFYPSSYF